MYSWTFGCVLMLHVLRSICISNNHKTNQSQERRQRRRARPTMPSLRLQAMGQSILPQRKEVVVSTQWTGSIAAGSLATTANFASILPLSLVQPFLPATGNTFAAAGAAPAFKGTSLLGSATTNNPIGYNYLSTNWSTYKVLDYEVILTVTPQSSQDPVAMAIAPLGDQEQPTLSTWTYFDICAQRFSRSGRAINGANTRLNSLAFRSSAHRDLGLTQQQWMDFPQTAMGAQPSGSNTVAYVGVLLASLNGATNSIATLVDVELRQRVIVSDPVQFGS